jgi:two-component system response regulator RegX3
MRSPPSKKPRALVVEDEAAIRNGLCDVLVYRGFDVHAVIDGPSALLVAQQERFDLVLLDVMLPELDGFRVCAQLRERGDRTPVLMLTARGSEEDIIRGFESGADDYVTKPFSVRELAARVQALLRRAGRGQDGCFRAGPFEVDPSRNLARADGAEIELTTREVRILQLLAEDPGRIVSRRTLLREAWDMNNAENVETRTVDMHIAKLRKKLGPRADGLVETVRGGGYRLWTAAR